MKRYKKALIAALAITLPSLTHAQDIKGLTVTAGIDSVYVFGFNLKESRSAKGGIWNLRTGSGYALPRIGTGQPSSERMGNLGV